MNQPTTLVALLFLAACGPLPVDVVDETGEDDVATSIFRNNLRRVNLQPQGLSQAVIDVSTEDEFRAALTSLPVLTGDCYGRGIRVVAAITLTSPIELGLQHAGITITSSSRVIVSSRNTVTTDALFVVTADDVVIENIIVDDAVVQTTFVQLSASRFTVRGIDLGTAPTLAIFVRIDTANIADLTVTDNRINNGSCTMVSAVGGEISRGIISRNTGFVVGGISVSSLVSVNITSNNALGAINSATNPSRNVISGNQMQGSIQLSGASGENVISGNAMDGQGITTDGTTGENTIFGNSNCGALTNHATDAVGLNT